jgi:uncharacterized protein YeaO (DUF488 family)
MGHALRLKRAYEPASASDGRRILVDRLWPRGVAKADAHIDLWLKDIAPSAALRRWFGHEPERWPAFRERYLEELRSNPAVADLRQAIAAGPVTLVYGARDRERNDAVVLAAFIENGG